MVSQKFNVVFYSFSYQSNVTGCNFILSVLIISTVYKIFKSCQGYDVYSIFDVLIWFCNVNFSVLNNKHKMCIYFFLQFMCNKFLLSCHVFRWFNKTHALNNTDNLFFFLQMFHIKLFIIHASFILISMSRCHLLLALELVTMFSHLLWCCLLEIIGMEKIIILRISDVLIKRIHVCPPS